MSDVITDKRAVWKYPLGPGTQIVKMPKGARLLTVETQFGDPTLWALVDPDAELVARYFAVVGTGMTFDGAGLVYVGSAHNVASAGLVMHVFEGAPDV